MKKKPKVLLASMPWAPFQEPSLGLSILSSCLNNEGIDNEIKHLNIYLLKYLKSSSYKYLSDIIGLNEFLFSAAFERNVSADQLISLDQTISSILVNRTVIPFLKSRADYIDYLLEIRNVAIPKYLDYCANEVMVSGCTFLGLTCMFDQTIASLALAKTVKEQSSDITVCLGGYALEGVVGEQILRSFPFIDVIVQGDGEPSIVKLANYSVGEEEIEDIPNVIYVNRESEIQNSHLGDIKKIGVLNNQQIDNSLHRTKNIKIQLDNSPHPNYIPYFKDLDKLRTNDAVTITPSVLSIEASRGCWWGQKSHCIFCGIDSETLRYRKKSPENVMEMLNILKAQLGEYTYRLSDYILPQSYYGTVLPELSKQNPPMKLSCEMKSNIDDNKIRLLKDAGFVQVQPGIESFSTNVLRKMGKGVSGIQNILMLKLGKEFGLKVDWNFLYGFPNENINDYTSMLKTIPMLYHFDPPNSYDNVLVTRFAPLHTSPDRFDTSEAQPHVAYKTIFSDHFRDKIEFELKDYCYIFQPNWDNGLELETIYKLLATQISMWKELRIGQVSLTHELNDSGIVFTDARLNAKTPSVHRFSQEHSIVYQSIHTKIISFKKLAGLFNDFISEVELMSILKDFMDIRIVYTESQKYVGLSISDNSKYCSKMRRIGVGS